MKEENKITDIEINIVYENKILETHHLDNLNTKEITIDKHTYNIVPKYVFLYPTSKGYRPALFYRYGKKEPIHFKDTNKGIPARALKLLWSHSLYNILVQPEKDKTNLIIIILLLAVIGTFAIKMYLMYGGA